MTREEAVEVLKGIVEEASESKEAVCYVSADEDIDALNMAIEALEQEPKTGHWIGIDNYPHEDWECNNCGYVIEAFENPNDFRYCPNCGARMESEE